MENQKCSSCQKKVAPLQCGICNEALCKYCAHILDGEQFAFASKVSKDLTYNVYCNPCFNSKVSEALDKYNADIERAKDVLIFLKSQTKETRLLKRLADPLIVTECKDEEEVLMKLAYLALQLEYDGVIDVEVVSEKVKVGSHQHLKWRGRGIPTKIDYKKIPRDKSLRHKPN